MGVSASNWSVTSAFLQQIVYWRYPVGCNTRWWYVFHHVQLVGLHDNQWTIGCHLPCVRPLVSLFITGLLVMQWHWQSNLEVCLKDHLHLHYSWLIIQNQYASPLDLACHSLEASSRSCCWKRIAGGWRLFQHNADILPSQPVTLRQEQQGCKQQYW